jgi:peptidoglycan hydrolase-like protein with peptidoglycan-binding domain
MAVTSTNNLRKGSKGSDVTELQKLLNNNGYNLAVDGSFGGKTLAAVQDYQKKNGLAVDGIVGTNTWGALTKATNAAGQAPSQAAAPAETKAPTFEYSAYKPSDTVAQAEALLQQQMAQKPGAYQSTWEGQLNDTIAQILNREKFSYDLNVDALYQQYKDQYTTQGKLAMMDTMGQAAAMTGGYGNSYAQSVGQQAYQGYLQQLNDVVPELYGMALDQYSREGQQLYDQAALMAQQEDQDYVRYRDQLSDYYTELDRLTEDARYQSETDYGRWYDDRNFSYGQFADDRAYGYQQERDRVADEQWQKQYDEQVRQYNQQYALSKSKSSGGSGGSGGNGNGGSKANNGNRSEAEIIAMQKALGVDPDGKWGPKTQAAAQAQWGTTSADAAWEAKGKNLGGSPVGFTGSSYSEAASYIKANGGSASGLMTSSEWARHKNSLATTGQGGAEVKNYSSYQEYLRDYVEYAIAGNS